MQRKPDFTPRNVAKHAVQTIVIKKSSQLLQNALTNYTRINGDAQVVELAAHLVGWYISDQLKPLTDAAVDKVFTFVAVKFEERQAKKAKKTPKK